MCLRFQILVLLLFMGYISLNGQKDPGFTFDASLVDDSIGIIDPLFVKTSISNKSNKGKKIISPWEGAISVAFKKDSDTLWNSLGQLIVFYSGESGRYLITFPPGEETFYHRLHLEKVKRRRIINNDGNMEGERLKLSPSLEPGNYILKVSYCYDYGTKNRSKLPRASCKSSITHQLPFTVHNYIERPNRDAYDWLWQRQKIPRFIYDVTIKSISDQDKIDLLRSFVLEHENTVFTPFAHYQLAFQLNKQLPKEINIELVQKLTEIINHLEAAQSSTTNPWLQSLITPALRRATDTRWSANRTLLNKGGN